MQPFASGFYHSMTWRKTSKAYMKSQHYICERCGGPAKICHHKVWLTKKNIGDPEVALNWDNLEALCMDCHNKEHNSNQTAFNDDCMVDEYGDFVPKDR